MRLLMTPAQVVLSEAGTPAAVAWSAPEGLPSPAPGRRAPARRVISVIDAWRYDGRWWEPRELHRDYYLLELEGGAQLELYREGDAWWAARASD